MTFPVWIPDPLVRIRELEDALRDCREIACANLHSPGNENDTFDYIESVVSSVLQDGYIYVPEEDEDDLS